ncbi:Predicted thiol-disulfide oxidoreductase YuxK, DCC family [Natronoarchaeum philippinense]|uniref:Predicted thiol-disulfide oxidoreductase YuxK, DCC family n=1 Tax=Natronoarchaeum philippinense TaxID=558529 RepID=A0A285N183_NATPI|nr:DCC1-like thiol-disulfide oxidoreductase family protein [Natronoarchaeum philippinense]SNZ03212.1 Predicted thiol-disulfide oxidoreductase YuxK, DCC family [Natronoarchaeum philippinense]
MPETTLVYDDDCGFCTWWADFVDRRSDVRAVGFMDLTDDLQDRLPDDYEECAHLVTDETVYSCGAAMEQAFVRTDVPDELADLVEFARQFDDYRRLRESVYESIADNRETAGKVMSKTPPARRDDGD